MGYTKLDYEDYIENIDYWLGVEGVELPLWADRIADKGGKAVCEMHTFLFLASIGKIYTLRSIFTRLLGKNP